MTKKTKIYFIGRKQGIGHRRYRLSHLENRRKYEPEGLKDAKDKIKQVRLIQNADVIWVRVRPEHTNDKQRKIIENRLKKVRKKTVIINDISVFDNYDCKDTTFYLWKKQGIACPDYLTIEPKVDHADQIVDEISSFIRKYKKVFLRTNNETASLGMHTLTTSTSKEEIENTLSLLVARSRQHQKKRKATRVMAVEFFEQKSSGQYTDLYRVHIVFGKIISFYAVTSKKDIFHNIDMTNDDLERFIMLNENLSDKIYSLEPKLISAVESLGCNLGAIEFFLENNEPVFLELNPMWGGHASINGFGDSDMQSYLINNRGVLEDRIPNIYSFMDYRTYYKKLYEHIHDFMSVNANIK